MTSFVDEHTSARLAAQRLRNTLRANAATSFCGGFVATLAPGTLDRLLGTGETGWIRLVGIGLIGFALAVGTVGASRTSTMLRATPAITSADTGWSLASAITIAAGWFDTAGAVVVGAVAIVVAVFAARQMRHGRRTHRHSPASIDAFDETPAVEVAHIERTIEASVRDAWLVVTDHELYGRLASNLSRVHAHTGNGPGLQRSCANRGGRQWNESCTLWRDDDRFEVEVDTSDYPYPLAEVRGAWSVRAVDPNRTTVAIDFRFQPQATLRGRAFAAVMSAGIPLVVRRILTGWERELTTRPRAATADRLL